MSQDCDEEILVEFKSTWELIIKIIKSKNKNINLAKYLNSISTICFERGSTEHSFNLGKAI